MLGLLLFILIFAIIIPGILYKLKLYSILAVYYPNLDIIATILSYNAGFKDTIFSNLYNTQCKFNTEKDNVYSASEVIINYLSLMGLFISILTLSRGDAYEDIGHLSVMLLVTYLLPNQIIEIIMDYVQDAYKLNVANVVIIGLVLMSIIIAVEHYILDNYSGILTRGFKMLLTDLPKMINKI
tara:strand:+ start:183 stop:731 length:549 start_codon:yes stop_codon:yes gene_type:complete